MNCKTCGEEMIGNGYNTVIHCPYADTDYIEPDANPVHCEPEVSDELQTDSP